MGTGRASLELQLINVTVSYASYAIMFLLAPLFSCFALALIASVQSLPFAGGKSTRDLYGCRCDDDSVPAELSEQLPPPEMLDQLKNELLHKPHPMFLLSEMAENIHQNRLCPSLCDGTMSPQVEEDTRVYVNKTMMEYLNGIATSDTDPCPPRFNVTHYPKRYPRYLVEIVCDTDGPHVKRRSCSYCSLGDNRPSDQIVQSGFCRKYSLRQMQYLTKDPHASGCSRSGPPTWHQCILPDVGVGCECV